MNAPVASPSAGNQAARQAILGQGVNMWLPIAQGTISQVGQTINVPVRNVGLIKRFLIKIVGNVTQAAAETQTLTVQGGSNVLSNVTFTDLSNQQRINTPGWHLTHLATARRQGAWGAAVTTDTPFGYGSKFPVNKFASSVTTVQAWSHFTEVPIAYGDFDLRGAIYANVVNATMQLSFTINPNFGIGSGGNPVLSVYQSSTANDIVSVTGMSYVVYQNFIDQLPIGKNGMPVLPGLDLATAYLLNSSVFAPLINGQDNPIPFSNFRQFLSTMVILDNNGTLGAGTDVNNWSLQSANYTNVWKVDPFTSKLFEREIIFDDFPLGTYYFDSRARPISTIQYGNMQLILNPTGLNAAARALVGWEALAQINQVTQAGSLAGV